METKKIVEELERVNDINTLSLAELANKYLKDEETYNEFITNYGEFFVNGLLYQLRAIPHFRKIANLVESGTIMYQSEENEEKAKKIYKSIDHILNRFKTRSLVQDESQANALFTDLVGAERCSEAKRYEKVVTGILDAAKKYEASDNNSIDEFVFFALRVAKNHKEEYNEIINKYMDEHKLAYLCNDVNFLYFINYMLKLRASYVDKEFIDDSKNVILESISLNENKLPNNNKNSSDKNYFKVAKYTLKNIYKYENKKEKEEIKKLKK